MSGKEIKDYIINNDDIYYNIIVLDDFGNKWKFTDINDDTDYDFVKIDEMIIGSGMLMAYYRIK